MLVEGGVWVHWWDLIASDAPTNIFDLNVVLALCFVSCFAGGGEIMVLL